MQYARIGVLFLAFSLSLGAAGARAANQLPSCKDLDQMVATLDQAAEALDKLLKRDCS